MEIITLLLFSSVLVTCVIAKISILYALIAGYIIFFSYALLKKHPAAKVIQMSISGIYTAKNILLTFILIGMLTALWRAAGTIPAIVCYTITLIKPAIFVLMTFLLNCFVSFLTGTSFGTAATIGVICMTMALTLEISPLIIGGAILSGIYFGDRCSPVSTSALLIAELTATDIFQNINSMMKTAFVPFILTCTIYTVIGIIMPHNTEKFLNIQDLFVKSFHLGWITLVPAIIMLIFSLLKIKVKTTMLTSIAAAIIICLFYQQLSINHIIQIIILGYDSPNPKIANMLNGGGIISMLKVAAIVCISSSYSGIFTGTNLLDKLKIWITSLKTKSSPYAITLFISIITSLIACNQTLTIMLTKQMCDTIENTKNELAIDLENTAVVIAPLIPWSIASAVPLASVSAPVSCLFAACYLYLLPLWRLIIDFMPESNISIIKKSTNI